MRNISSDTGFSAFEYMKKLSMVLAGFLREAFFKKAFDNLILIYLHQTYSTMLEKSTFSLTASPMILSSEISV